MKNHEDQLRKAKEMGVEMPKYIKPGAVNPLSYASQIQKRKQLWAKPAAAAPSPAVEEESKEREVTNTPAAGKQGGSYNNWESTNFGNDKANEKFRRLMGIKSGGESSASTTDPTRAAPAKDHEKIMNDLDRNYEAARQQTHRNRGIGLGFSDSGSYTQPPEPAPAPAPAPLGSGNMFRNAGWQNRSSGGINFVKKH